MTYDNTNEEITFLICLQFPFKEINYIHFTAFKYILKTSANKSMLIISLALDKVNKNHP